jgi:hypothetical protein
MFAPAIVLYEEVMGENEEVKAYEAESTDPYTLELRTYDDERDEREKLEVPKILPVTPVVNIDPVIYISEVTSNELLT